VLKNRGYEVSSVLDNDAAKRVLDKRQSYRLFIVGHAAPNRNQRRNSPVVENDLSRLEDFGTESHVPHESCRGRLQSPPE